MAPPRVWIHRPSKSQSCLGLVRWAMRGSPAIPSESNCVSKHFKNSKLQQNIISLCIFMYFSFFQMLNSLWNHKCISIRVGLFKCGYLWGIESIMGFAESIRDLYWKFGRLYRAFWVLTCGPPTCKQKASVQPLCVRRVGPRNQKETEHMTNWVANAKAPEKC